MAQDKKVKILDCTIRDGGYLNLIIPRSKLRGIIKFKGH